MAPGSRSTPLVEAVSLIKEAKLHIHYDERGLGFYALGLAKALNEPVAIIVTSGTAVGNLLPSVMEAHHSAIPLILLTADRPLELRDCGANQATDQVKIFQPFVRWQTDLADSVGEATVRSMAAQGAFYAKQTPPGPIHINCQFRDPLHRPDLTISPGKPLQLHFPRHVAEPLKSAVSKGLILIGKLPHPTDLTSILELANRLQWPICADILSNARAHPTKEQIRYYDWIEKPTPDLVLHFGERLTSKRILEWLKKTKPQYTHISPYPFLQDPERLLTARVQSDIPEFCQSFEAATDPTWLKSWEDHAPLFEEDGSFTEVHAMREVAETLPAGFGVFLGNGMPIRDADHFLFPSNSCKFFANRGLSGIDGNIATIAGLAESMPILGIIGDQTALYDLNSLPLIKKSRYPVKLLISNNFGSGIFHHLPVAQSPNFETLWAAAHDLRFEKAAQMFDIPYLSFEDLFKTEGSAIIELNTCRKANHQYQKSWKNLCSPALR